jgi:hypothetical protein
VHLELSIEQAQANRNEAEATEVAKDLRDFAESLAALRNVATAATNNNAEALAVLGLIRVASALKLVVDLLDPSFCGRRLRLRMRSAGWSIRSARQSEFRENAYVTRIFRRDANEATPRGYVVAKIRRLTGFRLKHALSTPQLVRSLGRRTQSDYPIQRKPKIGEC